MTGFQPLHPFPARMAPELAMKGLDTTDRKQITVLDPMCGSGTVLAEASKGGHVAIGTDIDPLATLISNCIVNPVTSDSVISGGDFVLDQAVSSRDASHLSWPDVETEQFVSFWFDEVIARDLSALASVIRTAAVTEELRNYLWCAFSRMIIVKSNGASRAMDLSHSRPHRSRHTRSMCPFERFEREVRIVAERLSTFLGVLPAAPEGDVLRADARVLPLGEASVDCVITSPPYLNAIDYVRMSKFTLVWLGHSISQLRTIRSASMGSEAGKGTEFGTNVPWHRFGPLMDLQGRHRCMVARFVYDILRMSEEVSRVLRVGGSFTIIIGNSAIRGVYVENAEIVKWAISQACLDIESEEYREIPDDRRYLPPPSTQQGHTTRMREEVVLTGTKN